MLKYTYQKILEPQLTELWSTSALRVLSKDSLRWVSIFNGYIRKSNTLEKMRTTVEKIIRKR